MMVGKNLLHLIHKPVSAAILLYPISPRAIQLSIYVIEVGYYRKGCAASKLVCAGEAFLSIIRFPGTCTDHYPICIQSFQYIAGFNIEAVKITEWLTKNRRFAYPCSFN